MSKIISEENPEAAQSSNAPQPGGGAKDRIRKQARQLAYDTRYKVKKNFAKGQKTDAVALKRAYLSQLQKSPAPGPVKELAKKMLVGEEYDFTDVSTLITDSVNLAFNKVFVKKTDLEDAEGNLAYEVIDFVQEASSERKYQVRVTDKESKKTYVRMATREKIAQLRSNPKISSVEMTGHGDPYEGKKKADKDYDGDGKKESPTAEYKGSRDKAIKKSIAKEEFIDEVNDAEDDNPDANVKKIDVMKGKNKIKISPTQSEAVDPATSNKKEPKPDAGVANREKRVSMMKRQILQKKMQAVRSGAGADIVAHHEPEGEVLTEEFINESVDFATEYFYKEGLNEEGLDLVIEDVGIDEFTEFVLGLQEDLNEERSAERAKPRDYAKVKASVDKTDAKHKAAGTREYSKSAAAKRNYGDKPAPEGKPEKKAATKKKVVASVAKAKKAQPAKPISKSGLGSKIRSAVSKGVERHKAATKKASGQVKKIAKTASDTAKQHAGHRKKFVSGLKATSKEKKIASGVGKAVKRAVVGEDAQYGYDKDGKSLNPADKEADKPDVPPNSVTFDGGATIEPVGDPREFPSIVRLIKNKLRARGLNMSYEPQGEMVEAKVDTAKKLDDEGKEDARNLRKYGTKHSQFMQAVRRRGEHRSERGVKKIKGQKPAPQGAYGESYTVTAADKKGNTPAWQGYKSGKKNVKTGKPLYKAADHVTKEEKDQAFANVVAKLRAQHGASGVLTKDSPKPKPQPAAKPKPEKPLTAAQKAQREVDVRKPRAGESD